MKNVFLALGALVLGFGTVASAGEVCGNTYCRPGYACITSRCLPNDPCYHPPYCKYVGYGETSQSTVSNGFVAASFTFPLAGN
jgi:hypothetical protein